MYIFTVHAQLFNFYAHALPTKSTIKLNQKFKIFLYIGSEQQTDRCVLGFMRWSFIFSVP
jgi:hypothetical protein